MDPTMQGGAPMGITPEIQNQMKNAMMLQAIKAGAAGGAAPQTAGMGQVPMSQAGTPPVDPAGMQGSNPYAQMQGMGQVPPAQPDPVANALMSQIPGGQ